MHIQGGNSQPKGKGHPVLHGLLSTGVKLGLTAFFGPAVGAAGGKAMDVIAANTFDKGSADRGGSQFPGDPNWFSA